LKRYAKFAVCGACAGLANGFFGAGGGLFLIPLFIRWCGLTEEKAFPTSVFVIFPLCVVSAAIYFANGAIDFVFALPYFIGGFSGGIVGGKYFKKIPAGALRRVFGALILYGGIKAAFFL